MEGPHTSDGRGHCFRPDGHEPPLPSPGLIQPCERPGPQCLVVVIQEQNRVRDGGSVEARVEAVQKVIGRRHNQPATGHLRDEVLWR